MKKGNQPKATPLGSSFTLDDLLETMPDGVVALDTSCRIRLWNASMTRLTGYTTQDVLGRDCSLLECAQCQHQEKQQSASACELIQSGSDHTMRRECSIRTRDGQLIPVLRSARVLRTPEGVVRGVIETFTDLRYRRRPAHDRSMRWQQGRSRTTARY
jgi:PAS domain S-box-containing protein